LHFSATGYNNIVANIIGGELLVTSHSCDQAKAAKLNYWRDFRSPVGSSLLAHVVVVAVAAAVAAGEYRVTATSVALSSHIEEDTISTN
jgi:hypothetical protein